MYLSDIYCTSCCYYVCILEWIKNWIELNWVLCNVMSGKPCNIIQLLTYVDVDMECYWTVNVILTDAERRSIWLSSLFDNTPCLPKHKSTIVLLYYKCMLCIFCHFRPLKRWRYAWDPKYSWFHEHSKNWINFLNDALNVTQTANHNVFTPKVRYENKFHDI